MPDGRSILFYSDREVTQGIWRVPVGPGLRVGEPELLRADVWRLIPLGFSRNAYFYGVPVEQPQVHTGAIDVGAGRILRSPTPVQDVSEGMSAAGDWSPDGRYLAYATTDPLTQGVRLVVRPVTGDGTREIPLALKGVQKVRWGPDSRTVMIGGMLPQLADALHRVHLAQGRMETLLCFYGISAVENVEAVPDKCPAPVTEGVRHFVDFSPDRQTVYFARGNPFRGEATVVARNLTNGAEREVATVRSLLNLSVSPDGSTLAMVDQDLPEQVNRLLTVPASGGELRVLHTVEGAWGVELESGLPWTPDGRFILFITEGDGALWRIPSAGGEPERLFELPGAWDYRHFRLHPDGSRIAYSTGETKGEIWRIENLPGLDGSGGSR
jgi:Tol biopolymer transport system component